MIDYRLRAAPGRRRVYRVATLEFTVDRASPFTVPPDAESLIIVNPSNLSVLIGFGFPEPPSVLAAEFELPVPPRAMVTVPILSNVPGPRDRPLELLATMFAATGESGDPDIWAQAFSIVSIYASDVFMPPRVDRFLSSEGGMFGGFNSYAVTVTTSVTNLNPTADTAVRGMFLQNLGTADVYLGDSAVTTGTGLRLAVGETLYWPSGSSLFGRAAAGSHDVRVIQVK